MTLDDFKQFFEHLATVILPKLFTVTATGNLLFAGLAAADVVSIVVSLGSFVFMTVVFWCTLNNKRRQAYLTEVQIKEAEASLAFHRANVQPHPTEVNSVSEGE